MIIIVNTAPLTFEQIVREELQVPLAEHGFQVEATFHKFGGQMVTFARRREQQQEEIVFQRAFYNSEQMKASDVDDEVESVPIDFGSEVHGPDPYWVSRHSLSVQFLVNGATNWLQRDGRAGTGDDYWWDFTDEQHLRRLLRELLPLILTAGLQDFDLMLEDAREKAST